MTASKRANIHEILPIMRELNALLKDETKLLEELKPREANKFLEKKRALYQRYQNMLGQLSRDDFSLLQEKEKNELKHLIKVFEGNVVANQEACEIALRLNEKIIQTLIYAIHVAQKETGAYCQAEDRERKDDMKPAIVSKIL